MPTGIKFISSLSGGPSTVGVGLSTIVGPTNWNVWVKRIM